MRSSYTQAVLLKNAKLCWEKRARALYPEAWEQRMWLTLLFWAQSREENPA